MISFLTFLGSTVSKMLHLLTNFVCYTILVLMGPFPSQEVPHNPNRAKLPVFFNGFLKHFEEAKAARSNWRTSGAVLQALNLAFDGPTMEKECGLHTCVADDSTKVGWLMVVERMWGLPRALPDRNKGFVCPEVDGRHLENKYPQQLR